MCLFHTCEFDFFKGACQLGLQQLSNVALLSVANTVKTIRCLMCTEVFLIVATDLQPYRVSLILFLSCL